MAETANVQVLENEFLEIDRVEFAGATKWADFALSVPTLLTACMEAARNELGDFRRIRKNSYS